MRQTFLFLSGPRALAAGARQNELIIQRDNGIECPPLLSMTTDIGTIAPNGRSVLLGALFHQIPVADRVRTNQGVENMNTFTTMDGTELFYKDWGNGPVVTFSHGWPLSSDAWDAQLLYLCQHGYRVVAH